MFEITVTQVTPTIFGLFDLNKPTMPRAFNVLEGIANGQIVSEAGTGAPTHNMIEVGVNTAESHRQRGLGWMVCAKLISECEARGHQTWWDCAARNIASVKLAEKLGYIHGREYRYRWWKSEK